MKAIMYHYVRESQESLPHFKYLHIEDFKKQLDYFEKEFGFVSKSDFLGSFETGIVPHGAVLTFDDGLSDHYKYVLPELIKRNLWASFYVSSGPYKNKKLLGPHRIHMLLGTFGGAAILKAMKEIITPEIIMLEKIKDFTLLTYKTITDISATAEVKRTLNFFIAEEHREHILNLLMEKFFGKTEHDLVGNFYMKSSELKELSLAGMIVGNHTVNHPVMSKLSYENQKKEIIPAFRFLEESIGNLEVKTYCHTYGGDHSFNNDTIKILKEEEVLFSWNLKDKDIDKNDLKNERQALPRYDCNAFPHGQVRTVSE